MRAGQLDRRVTLQRRVLTQNSYGEAIETWVDLAVVWAAYRPLRGAERVYAAQTVAEGDIKWLIRCRPGITPIDRLLYKGEVYDITSVIELGRREGYELYTKKVN